MLKADDEPSRDHGGQHCEDMSDYKAFARRGQTRFVETIIRLTFSFRKFPTTDRAQSLASIQRQSWPVAGCCSDFGP